MAQTEHPANNFLVFTDRSVASFGVHCNGSVYDHAGVFSGHSVPLSDATVVAFTIDTFAGTLSVQKDLGETRVVFGLGAQGFDEADCKLQTAEIKSGKLHLVMAILGAERDPEAGDHPRRNTRGNSRPIRGGRRGGL